MTTLENNILCERTRHNGQVMNEFIYTKGPEKIDPLRRKEISGCHRLRKGEWETLMMVIDS